MLPRLSLRSHCPPGRLSDLVFVRELLIPATLGTYLGSLASGCLSLSLSLSPSLVTSRPVAHTPRVPECRDDLCFTTIQPSQPPIETSIGLGFRVPALGPNPSVLEYRFFSPRLPPTRSIYRDKQFGTQPTKIKNNLDE